ncbi:MAG: DNA-3-methyladenine glycosylase I [Bacteroidales bacterium]|nr:DNA-3-methyladenine glycosylase I [Bacteroidales bacterium]
MTTNLIRCEWCGSDHNYVRYHDEEWGVPVHDDRKHFEFLVLESAQAGLSWLTVLRKRENYRKAYDRFDPALVAEYDQIKINELLANEGIIRNKLKITSSISNARHFLEIQKEYGSFDNYFRGYVGHKTIQNHFKTLEDLPARTEISDRIALDLKKRGFKFLGTKIIYAHMQAAGLVNDHVKSCFRYSQLGGD